MKNVFVTGGLGYIGSHTCVALIENGLNVYIIDNLSNSYSVVVDRIEDITGVKPKFIEADVRDCKVTEAALADNNIDAVVHFAGLKSVEESIAQPIHYFDNNVAGTLSLLNAMRNTGVKDLVFSSSATVYGNPKTLPIRECEPLQPSNPYGRSKSIVEEILADLANAEREWSIARLRYFNPVGAHVSGLIGEEPRDIPNNLMPFIAQVAAGRRQKLKVFGGDYDTPDGSGVRDYLHVMDLADGHVAALKYCHENRGLLTANLGTGRGTSVLKLVKTFESATGVTIPFEIVRRRPGDVAECWADSAFARDKLKWAAVRTLEDMCVDTWRWQSGNPTGYQPD